MTTKSFASAGDPQIWAVQPNTLTCCQRFLVHRHNLTLYSIMINKRFIYIKNLENYNKDVK